MTMLIKIAKCIYVEYCYYKHVVQDFYWIYTYEYESLQNFLENKDRSTAGARARAPLFEIFKDLFLKY